jgi:hypothetical protein
MKLISAQVPLFQRPFHRGQGGGLVLGHHLALLVAGGERHENAGQQPDDHADLEEDLRLFEVDVAQGVVGADRGHHERAVTTAAIMLCAYSTSAHGLSRKVRKLAIWKLPSRATRWPTGCCMKALVAMMK